MTSGLAAQAEAYRCSSQSRWTNTGNVTQTHKRLVCCIPVVSRERVDSPNTGDRLAFAPRNRLELAASDRGVPVWDPAKKSRNNLVGAFRCPFFAVGLFDGSTAVLCLRG